MATPPRNTWKPETRAKRIEETVTKAEKRKAGDSV